jgi:hypothetical protein
MAAGVAVPVLKPGRYPDKSGMGWPTYLLVSEAETDFEIHGELKGGMPKGDFRERLSALLPEAV